MADKTINELTAATTMGNDDLLVLQQGGTAKKLSGKQLGDYVYNAAAEKVAEVNQAVDDARSSINDIVESVQSMTELGTDTTLTTTGMAADAKAAGDKIKAVETAALADLSQGTASGSIVTITDGADNIPIKKLKIDIEPVQAGSGDPSPDNVRPISGWTGAKVTRTGKNLLPTLYNKAAYNPTFSDALYIKAGTYYVSWNVVNATNWRLGIRTYNKNGEEVNDHIYCPVANDGNTVLTWNNTNHCWLQGSNVTTKSHKLQFNVDMIAVFMLAVGDLTRDSVINNAMLSLEESASYEPYLSTTYDISFPSEAGTVYGGDLEINEDGSGALTVDRKHKQLTGDDFIALSSVTVPEGYIMPRTDNISEMPISASMYRYNKCYCDAFKTFKTDAELTQSAIVFGASNRMIFVCVETSLVGTTLESIKAYFDSNPINIVYPLVTSQTYSLTAPQVKTLLGLNNILADTGDIAEFVYRKAPVDSSDIDSKITEADETTRAVIESMIAGRETAMKATKNYTSGSLVIVNHTIYKLDANVASGETLTPGANCHMTTVEAENASRVPDTRTVNDKALSSDITLTAEDIAYDDSLSDHTSGSVGESISDVEEETNCAKALAGADYSSFIQGYRRTADAGAITASATRCTTSVCFPLKKGQRLHVTNLAEGQKFAVASLGGEDSGWQTGDYLYVAKADGLFFVNIAKTDTSATILPSEVTNIVKIYDYETLEWLVHTTYLKHNLVDYERAVGSVRYQGPIDILNTAVYFDGFWLDGAKPEYSNFVVRLTVSSALNTTGREYVRAYTEGIELAQNHKYRVHIHHVDGIIEGEYAIPTISVYRTGEYTTMAATYRVSEHHTYSEFTYDGSAVNFVAFLNIANKSGSFNNCRFLVLLEDITDEATFKSSKIDTLISDGYYEINSFTEMVDGSFTSSGYTKDTNRCHCKNIYLKAHKGDRVVASSGSANVLVGLTDNPEGTTILYTSGWVPYHEWTVDQDGYYILLAYCNYADFDGSFKIYPKLSDRHIHDVFDSEVNATINSVKELQTEPSIVFPLCTDLHFGFSENGDNYLFENKTVENMRRVLEQIRADLVVCLGDITNGDSANTEKYAYKVGNYLRSFDVPYLLAIGNHDDNRYRTGYTFDAEKMYETYNSYTYNNVVMNVATKGRDFYYDLDVYKVRFVSIDSNLLGSYGFSPDTVSWFTNTALDTPNGYAVVVLVHTSPMPEQNYNDLAITNNTQISQAIQDYQTSGKPILQLYGHSHCDAAFTTPYLSVATNCGKFENTNGDESLWPEGATKPSRVMGEVSEDCWDMVVLRPFSRKINFVRFGAGEDRGYTY